MKTELKPAIFLDRDGVLNHDSNHVHKIEDMIILPGVIDALKLLSQKYSLFIVTNQSGIGRKLFTLEDCHIFTGHMLNIFKEEGITIQEVYICQHHPDEKCICRKPNPSSLFHAKEHYDIDLKKSWVIGDRWSDVLLGHNAGCRTILVDGRPQDKEKVTPDFHAKDLREAADIILKLRN